MNLLRPTLLFSCILLLAACTTTPQRTTQYYVITPIEQITPIATNPNLRVNVSAVRVPPYLSKSSIITRNSQNTLHIADNHRWGGKLRKNLGRIMAQNLSALLATPHIVTAPINIPTTPDVLVDINILQFERNKDQRVILKAQWQLVKAKNLSPISTKMIDLTGEQLQASNNYDSTVASMSKLFGQLSEAIARSITEYK